MERRWTCGTHFRTSEQEIKNNLNIKRPGKNQVFFMQYYLVERYLMASSITLSANVLGLLVICATSVSEGGVT